MKNSKRLFILVGIIALAITFFALITKVIDSNDDGPTESALEMTESPKIDSYYNYPYGEVFIISRSGLDVTIDVYNSTNVSPFDQKAWSVLNEDELASDFEAVRATVNAPKYWVVDSITGLEIDDSTPMYKVGSINVQKINTIFAGTFGRDFNAEPYSENVIDSSATFTWKSGTEVYELIDTSGNIYRIQAYSQAVDDSITINNLKSLDTKLDVPAGWKYETRVLDEDFSISEPKATLIGDELGNSYLRIN
jgi:hypothetical protein